MSNLITNMIISDFRYSIYLVKPQITARKGGLVWNVDLFYKVLYTYKNLMTYVNMWQGYTSFGYFLWEERKRKML